MATSLFQLDAIVLGGGVAGLLTLDALHRRGCHAWLVERNALGCGQTMWSQGIIHGGLKYALGGSAGAAAKAVSAMPDRWTAMLGGHEEPNLSAVKMRADACAIWSTGSAASMVGLLGAALAIRSGPKPWPKEEIPNALAGVPGRVLQVREPVLEPSSLVSVLAAMHSDRVMLGDVVSIEHTEPGAHLTIRTPSNEINVGCRHLMLCAGGGNDQLRQIAGLSPGRMQTRPLRMVLARGDLPRLNGHCIRGTKPWLTITTVRDEHNAAVWQVGGTVAEWGATASPADTIERAAAAIATALPGVNLNDVEWATYEAPRAEHATSDGGRPDTPGVLEDGAVLTAWPTKMALAPILADDLASRVDASNQLMPVPDGLERPDVATPPWKEVKQWTSVHSDTRA
jgi:glycine/D-amino acid oxidase-like deaminating enzyme